MDDLQQHQSFSDSKIKGECKEFIDTNTQNVKLSVDSDNIDKALALSVEFIPTSSVEILSDNNHGIPQLFESGQGVGESTNVEDAVTEANQPDDSNNYRRTLSAEERTITNNGLVSIKGVRPKLGKNNGHYITVDPDPPDTSLSEIPADSGEIVYHGKAIPVKVKQFYDTKIIGQGKFGIVHRVSIKKPQKMRMVVKRVSCQKDENGFSSADIELIAMKKFASGGSPYIVAYYGAMIDPDHSQLCICMESMNTSVADFYPAMHLLDRDKVLKMLDPLVRRIIHNVASGLSALETEKTVHRDIKPANMLINKNAAVKLCDFGICGNWTEMTSRFRFVVGTARYLPPDPKPCAIDGDMWALGMSVLEIISGKHPFSDCKSVEELPYVIRDWKPTVPTTVSLDVQQLILSLLRKEAHERPQSYTEILSKPFIRDVHETPSNDERYFVRRVIKNIRGTDHDD